MLGISSSSGSVSLIFSFFFGHLPRLDQNYVLIPSMSYERAGLEEKRRMPSKGPSWKRTTGE